MNIVASHDQSHPCRHPRRKRTRTETHGIGTRPRIGQTLRDAAGRGFFAVLVLLLGMTGASRLVAAPEIIIPGVQPSFLAVKEGRIVWVEDSVEGSGDPSRMFCATPEIPLGGEIRTSTTEGHFGDVQFDGHFAWFFHRTTGSLGRAWYTPSIPPPDLLGRGVFDPSGPGHVLTANDAVYFADADGVQRMNGGGIAATLLSGVSEDRGVQSPWLAGNSQDLFWFTGPEAGRTLRRLPLNPPGPAVPIVTGVREPRWLRENAGEVFWADTQRQIWAKGYSPGLPRLVTTVDPSFDISGLAVTATHVYWSQKLVTGPFVDHPTILRALRGGGSPEVVAIGRNAEQLVRDGSYIYWVERGAIWRLQWDAFTPFVPDFAITGLEITQGIQNLANDVPMVPDKPTLARLFVTENSASGSRLRVSAVLHGLRDGVPLEGSPLRSTRPFVTVDHGQILSRADMDAGFLFVLPPAWRHGNVTLRAELNPDHLLPEANYVNNTATRNLAFLDKGGLCLAVTPVSTADGALVYGIDHPGFRDLIRRFESLYPIAQVDLVYEPAPMRRFGAPYTLPADGSFLVFDVFTRFVLSGVGSRCHPHSRLHWMAMVSPEANTSDAEGTELGRGALWTVASWVKMVSDAAPETGFGSPSGAHTLAQELGHNLNGVLGHRWLHVNCGSPEGLNTDYPYPTATIGPLGDTAYWGFDPISMRPIAPDAARDFMSYCSPAWTSDYNWRGLIQELPDRSFRAANLAGATPPGNPTPDLLLFGGSISPEGKLESVQPAYRLPAGFMDPGVLQTVLKKQAEFTGPDSTHVLEFRDAKDNLLAIQPFSPVSGGEHGPDKASVLIALLTPFPEGAARIVINHGKDTIGILPVSASPPQVSIVAPKAGTVVTDKLLVEWVGSDPDGDPLTYTLQYSPDGGTSWILLAQNITATQWESSTAQLPGGKGALVRVLATDGIHTAIATSDAFTTSDQPPVVWLDEPRPGTEFVADELIWLRGAAYDPESGMVPDDSLVWTIDGLGEVGRGRDLSLRPLPPGSYHASLTVPDTKGSVSQSVDFTVGKVQAPPIDPVSIQCPGDLEVPAAGVAGAVVKYPAPEVKGMPAGGVLVCQPPSGSVFAAGATVVVCQVLDWAGAVLGECRFKVTVTAAPVDCLKFNCPGDFVVNCQGPDGAKVNYPRPVGTNQCTGTAILWTCDPKPGLFPLGTTTVRCWGPVLDTGESAYCEFNVTVAGNCPVPPSCLVLQCPDGIKAPCQSPRGAVVKYDFVARNLCGGDVVTSCEPSSGSVFPPGATEVICTAVGNGETNRCHFTVFVEGDCAPGLKVRNPTGHSLVLVWPASATGYIPQQSDGLDLGEEAWHRVTDGILRVGDENQLTIVAGVQGSQFYRLFQPLEPRIPFVKPAKSAIDPMRSMPQQIVIKFHEGTHVGWRDGVLTFDPVALTPREQSLLRRVGLTPAQIASDVRAVNDQMASRAGARLARLFDTMSEGSLALNKSNGEALGGGELADLNLYFEVLDGTADGSGANVLIEALNGLASVEIAYAQPIVGEPDADLPPSSAEINLIPVQNYMDPAPTGIDARAAWSFPGGRGGRARVIDMESGWNLNHEDLPFRGPFVELGIPLPIEESREHGTAVLGILVADDNGFGATGIVPDVAYGVSSFVAVSLIPPRIGIAAAIVNAAAALRRGDVLQLEVHVNGPVTGTACACNCGQFEMLPAESWPAEWDAIRTATRNGIVVVEAAGNGSVSLDDLTYGGQFTPGHPNFRESGAIIVGASNGGVTTGADDRTSDTACFSNFGLRVDVHGWGGGVATLGYGALQANGDDFRQWYTTGFAGTSSATPMISGAICSLQSILRQRGLEPLTPGEMRDLFHAVGTPQWPNAWNQTHPIGRLPDLCKMINAVLPQAAEFVSQNVPTRMNAGQTYGVSVTLRNVGPANWEAGTYSLQSDNPPGSRVWEIQRVPLPVSVAPGASHEFAFTVRAPVIPGAYDFQWRLHQDGVEAIGCPTLNVRVVVGDAPGFESLRPDTLLSGPPSVGVNGDGRLEVFAMGLNNQILHLVQRSPDAGEYLGWEALTATGQFVNGGRLAVARNSDNRLEIFGLNLARRYAHLWQTVPGVLSRSGWSGTFTWNRGFVDPEFGNDPGAGANANGALEAFGRSDHGDMSHVVASLGLLGFWVSLDGQPVGTPAVLRSNDGRLHLFTRWSDGSIRHRAQTVPNGDWNPWESLGGSAFTSDPVAELNADGRMEVLARGGDGALFDQAEQVSPRVFPHAWTSLGGSLRGRPTVIANADGRLDVVVTSAPTGSVDHLAQTVRNGPWGTWETLGETGASSDPAVGRNALSGRLEVFVRGGDQSLHHRKQVTAGTWR